MTDITQRLREASHSYDEWRVQDPKDGSYCIAFSWPEVLNPEREAREWLADHKARFPNGLHAGFVVACVRVTPTKDRLMLEAADEIARLRAALRGLLRRDERNTCQHEETHRGGAIWEICDQCGMKWADDRGGKPAWQDPPEWVAARAALGE